MTNQTNPQNSNQKTDRKINWNTATVGLAMIIIGYVLFEDTMTTVFVTGGFAMIICGIMNVPVFGKRDREQKPEAA